MSEMTRSQLWAEFVSVAEQATPNSEATFTAQAQFKRIMGLTDEQTKNTHLSLPSAQTAFTEAVAELVAQRTGTTLQTTASYETLKSMLPETDQSQKKGIGQVLNKLELQFGMREPLTFGK